MFELIEYLRDHVLRGECTCGECVDAKPGKPQPSGKHVSDLVFFKVALKDIEDKEKAKIELIEAIKNHKGVFGQVDLFDGKEHNYTEIGGWIGDQGLALELMGLGELLGMWKLYTPNLLLHPESEVDKMLCMKMAKMGYISIKV